MELIDKDDIINTRRSNNEGRVCYICGSSETYIDSEGREHWGYRRGEKGKWTGNWLCNTCIGVQICAVTLGVEDLNIQTDNFTYYVDLGVHTKYGFIEVKTATFNKRDGRQYFHDIHKEKFNYLFLVCMDQYGPWKNVLRIYAIPSDNITTSTTITIYENSSIRGPRWYEEFEIDAKHFNDTYHKMDISVCPVLRKR